MKNPQLSQVIANQIRMGAAVYQSTRFRGINHFTVKTGKMTSDQILTQLEQSMSQHQKQETLLLDHRQQQMQMKQMLQNNLIIEKSTQKPRDPRFKCLKMLDKDEILTNGGVVDDEDYQQPEQMMVGAAGGGARGKERSFEVKHGVAGSTYKLRVGDVSMP